MSEFVSIGHNISIASIRAYLFAKTVNPGDTLVLNPTDYAAVTDEVKHSQEQIEIPLNVLGVLLSKDTTGSVPAGKVQIVKNESLQ